MKIICEKEKILKALNSVTKAIAVRTTMPILEGILIQTNDNEIKLTTFNLSEKQQIKLKKEIKEIEIELTKDASEKIKLSEEVEALEELLQ
jgi:DNA polymerase-3 subunit beta